MTPNAICWILLVAGAYAVWRRRGRSDMAPPVAWWETVLGFLAILAVALIIINPELAALGLFGDTAFIDLLVVLMSLKFRCVGIEAWSWVRERLPEIFWSGSLPRLSYLLFITARAALNRAISADGILRLKAKRTLCV